MPIVAIQVTREGTKPSANSVTAEHKHRDDTGLRNH